MLQVKPNDRKEVILTNQKLRGFSVNMLITAAVVNTIPSSLDVDFSKTLLKVILKRDGHTIIIMQDDLKTIGLHMNLTTMSRRAFYQDHEFGVSLIANAAAVKGQRVLGFDVRLPGVLELTGSDQLIVECTLNSNMFTSVVDLNTSYLELKPLKTTAFEKFVPLVRSYSISAGERRRSFDLGSNVISVTLLNYDQGYYFTPVVQSITLSSSKLDETYSFMDLVNSKVIGRYDPGIDPINLPSFTTAEDFDQCFVIIEDTELDNVNVDIQFNPSAVTANNNILVVASAYTDIKTLIEHDAKVLQAQNEKLATLKQNGENAKIA